MDAGHVAPLWSVILVLIVGAQGRGQAVELQTKVPEDYAKFYNHEKAPTRGSVVLWIALCSEEEWCSWWRHIYFKPLHSTLHGRADKKGECIQVSITWQICIKSCHWPGPEEDCLVSTLKLSTKFCESFIWALKHGLSAKFSTEGS